MVRKIIQIDEERCNGCGACANACHEGAIGMVDGKAKLLRDDYCDGLGDCLPACPVDAIHFVEREAAEYDAEAVKKHMEQSAAQEQKSFVCPGARIKMMKREEHTAQETNAKSGEEMVSRLSNWPVQIKLAPTKAPYFDGAKLLIAADCSAYAYGDFHNQFIRGRVTLIGCPKLDQVDYTEKLTEIIRNNDVKSVMVVKMEVPCCGGIERAVVDAMKASGKFIPWQVMTITTDGRMLEN